MTKRQYTWYVRPLDAGHTNEAIIRILDALALTEESLNQAKICEDGERFNVLQIPREIVSYLLKSRDELNLNFKLYIQEGKVRDGKIREANWLHCQRKRPRTRVKS